MTEPTQSQPEQVEGEPDDKQRATWHEIAIEFAEETIEHGASAYIAPQTAEAVAQTIVAQEAALKNERLLKRLTVVRAEQAEAREAELLTSLEEARRRECHHGWRGSVPDNGQRIVTPCPECGAQSLFIGSGGHLTCARVPTDHTDGCPAPSVKDVVKKLKQRLEFAEAALREERKAGMEEGAAERKVEALRNLPNWDSSPITDKTIDAAKRIARMLGDKWTVVPVNDGSVQFGWPADEVTVCVWAGDDADVEAMPIHSLQSTTPESR